MKRSKAVVNVFLVENNPDDEALIRHALGKCGIDHEVLVAHDGAEALELLTARASRGGRTRRDWPRLVLLDLRLPKVDGLEVLRRLQADSRAKCLPVVVLTSSSEDEDLVKSYRLGANSFVRKPVEAEALSEAVQQVGRYWLGLNEPRPAEG